MLRSRTGLLWKSWWIVPDQISGCRPSVRCSPVSSLAGSDGFPRALELEIGKGAGDDVAKHGCLLVGRAIEPGLVGELEADPAALEPAHRAFDGAVLAQVKLDPVPQSRLEIGRDHRSATRQIDQLDRVSVSGMGQGHLLVGKAVAVLVAGVAAAGLLADDRDTVQRVGLRALGLLGLENGRFFGRSVPENLRPDIHP